MYFVYVIYSISRGTRYVGSAEDVVQRVSEHNAGRCRYTSGRRPWELIYTEEYSARSDAMRRERFLKSGQGREFLRQILKSYAGSAPEAHSPLARNSIPGAEKFAEL